MEPTGSGDPADRDDRGPGNGTDEPREPGSAARPVKDRPEVDVDEESEESFPASDAPPSWGRTAADDP